MPVLISGVARSPFALADHALAGWHPVDLGAIVLREALQRCDLEASAVDEVVVGCAEPVGAQGANVSRAIALATGWPDSISALVVDRGESSGSAALHLGCASIAAGQADTVAVIGVCSASMVQPGASALGRLYGRPWGDAPAHRAKDSGGLLPLVPMADLVASQRGITFEQQAAWAQRSRRSRPANHQAIIAVGARAGDSIALQRDSPVGSDQLYEPEPTDNHEPIFDSDGSTTSATFAPAADGISVVILQRHNPNAIGAIVGTGRAAGSVDDPTGGAAAALRRALSSARLQPDQIDRWDLCEPSASATLVMMNELGLDPALTNPRGGTLAVGDAGAAEDLRLLVDALAQAPSPQSRSAEIGATIVGGPTGGAAATIWQRLAQPPTLS